MSTNKPILTLPSPAPLLSRTGWSTFIVALILVCAVAPALNLLVPKGSLFHLSDYAVALTGKIMCYAICALAMSRSPRKRPVSRSKRKISTSDTAPELISGLVTSSSFDVSS